MQGRPSSDDLQRASRTVAWGLTVLLTAGCEVGGSRQFSVIPGPAVPSPLPTSAPYVWDTREELGIWVNNPVTWRPAPLSLVADGPGAFIRIEPELRLDGWVLRGPDLTPPARRVRGVRIRYQWRPDPTLQPGAALEFSLQASFEATNPPRPPEQPAAHGRLPPVSDWTDANFTPGSFRDPLDVKYFYFHRFGSNPGVFEIDRIELVQ